MPFESIIITGTSCAGKSTLASALCNTTTDEGIQFEQVKAITTRDPRPGDLIYEFVLDDEFERLRQNEELLVHSIYREKKYGIKNAEYLDALQRRKIPIIVITPAAASELLSKGESKYLCIFLDASDELLNERWEIRFSNPPSKYEKSQFNMQRETDRSFQDKAHYIFSCTDISAMVSLTISLWTYQNQGGALQHKLIKNMIDCGVLLRNADSTMIKGASYDLQLGDEYYYAGEIRKLSDCNLFLTIEPYDYAIVSCKETAWIPRDVTARFGLSVGLFCQGIILSNGPQIDPGFRGTLFCLLFNTSNRPVHMKRGKHYATIEFNKLIGYADPYKGKYQGKENIIDYIPANALHGAINELKKEVEQLKAESRIMQNIYLGVAALMFTIISILLVIK